MTPPPAEKPPIPAVGRQHAVAWHDERERILPERAAHRPRGASVAEPGRHLAVRERRARRNAAGHLVDAAVERRHSGHVESDCGEIARLSVEKRDDAVHRLLHLGRRRRPRWAVREPPEYRGRASRLRRPVSGSCTPMTPRSLPHNAAPANGRVEERAKSEVFISDSLDSGVGECRARSIVGGPTPLANLRRVLAVVSSAGALEQLAGAAARLEMLIRHRSGGADEDPCATRRAPRGFRRSSRPSSAGRTARFHASKSSYVPAGYGASPWRCVRGRGHRLVPAGDVDQDLAHAPASEPDPAHLLIGQALDRSPELGERLVRLTQQSSPCRPSAPPGRNDVVVLRVRPRTGPAVKFGWPPYDAPTRTCPPRIRG